jgi:hypothetical protein
VVLWQLSHWRVVTKCPAGLPLAEVPLWQVLHLPAVPLWEKVAGVHPAVVWQT